MKVILAGLVGLIGPLLATELFTNIGIAFVLLGGIGGWISIGLWLRDGHRRKFLDAMLAEAAEKAEAEIAEAEKAKKAREERVQGEASQEPGVSETG